MFPKSSSISRVERAPMFDSPFHSISIIAIGGGGASAGKGAQRARDIWRINTR